MIEKIREIKFRGKTKEGEWIYGDLFRGMDGEAYIHIVDDYGQNVEVLHNTVGQYTGLKDVNGKEIYEGDILKTAFSNYVFGIVMCHSNGYFYILESQSFSIDLESDHTSLGEMLKMSIDGIPCNFRIIGNIYDNPELIEK